MTRIERKTAPYNPRRYGRPWIATVDFSDTPRGNYKWGHWIGTDGQQGCLVLNAEPGSIVAIGQRDRRAADNAPEFYVVAEGGELRHLKGGRGEAYMTWMETASRKGQTTEE